VRPERLVKFKTFIHLIEPTIFQLVAQCLNHSATTCMKFAASIFRAEAIVIFGHYGVCPALLITNFANKLNFFLTLSGAKITVHSGTNNPEVEDYSTN
jgi:hypothetical protein